MNRTYFFLFLTLLLATLLRLVLLNNVPDATTYDQIYYVLNAKSFLYTGTDLSGTITPLQILLFHYPAGALTQAELPFFLLFPFLSFLPLSLASVVLPNALLSILTVLMLYLIGKKLFDQKTALWISLIAAINPWFIVVGRTFYEPVPATFFYLCGFYVLLIARKWKILLAFPLFLLAFYSYIGTKLIFFPFILLSVLYCYFFIHKKQYIKQYIALLTLSFLTIIFFLLQLHQHPDSSRISEIISPSNPAIVRQVNDLRKVSVMGPLTNIFVNKITLYLQIVATNILNVFSPTYLFAQGDSFFALYRHGLFYLIDIIFLVLGVAFLFAEKRKLLVFFTLMIFLATLPQIFHDPRAGGNFTPHIALLFPFFIMLIGFGISKSTEYANNRFARTTLFVVGILYLFSLLNFVTVYFYQFPFHSEFFDFSPRVLSRYIDLAQKNQHNIMVYSASSDIAFQKYLFYSNVYTKQSARELNKALKEKNYYYNNVTFLRCPEERDLKNHTDVIIVDVLCGEFKKGDFISVAQLKDSGRTYNILNDKTCKQYNLQGYVSHIKLSDLNLADLDEKTFCEKFIVY